jgi:hypothetical protein
MINLIASIFVLFGYLAFVVVKFGIPPSISESYYLLGKKGWLFQIALMVTAFCVVPSLVDASSENTRFLAFLACAGLLFVAGAPLFKLRFDGKVHFISAALCCGGLVLWQVVNTSWVIPALSFGFACYPMLKGKKYMWWLEIATVTSAYVSLWLKIY